MLYGSFDFCGKNSVEDFGIYVKQYIPVAPDKRIDRLTIPNKPGTYKYSKKNVNDLRITLDLFCAEDVDRADFRLISSWLNQYGELKFWDEQDKHYVGEFEVFPQFDEQNLLRMKVMKADFVAQPFAYGERKSIDIGNVATNIVYKGTAPQPMALLITNPTATTVTKFTVTVVFDLGGGSTLSKTIAVNTSLAQNQSVLINGATYEVFKLTPGSPEVVESIVDSIGSFDFIDLDNSVGSIKVQSDSPSGVLLTGSVEFSEGWW